MPVYSCINGFKNLVVDKDGSTKIDLFIKVVNDMQ